MIQQWNYNDWTRLPKDHKCTLATDKRIYIVAFRNQFSVLQSYPLMHVCSFSYLIIANIEINVISIVRNKNIVCNKQHVVVKPIIGRQVRLFYSGIFCGSTTLYARPSHRKHSASTPGRLATQRGKLSRYARRTNIERVSI